VSAQSPSIGCRVADMCDCRFPGNDPAPGLDGTLPADYGFDPFGFIQDEESKNWYQQAELIHCRSVLH
jgi:hypothetical protein